MGHDLLFFIVQIIPEFAGETPSSWVLCLPLLISLPYFAAPGFPFCSIFTNVLAKKISSIPNNKRSNSIVLHLSAKQPIPDMN